MRPDPPAPDTPNSGRTLKYAPLVEPTPEAPLHDRRLQLTAAAAAVGAGAVLIVDAVVRGIL